MKAKCKTIKHLTNGPGKGILFIRGLWMLCLICASASPTVAQEHRHQLVDYVEVNIEIPGSQGSQGSQDSLYVLKFSEEWIIDPRKPSISKQVFEYDSACSDLSGRLALTYEFHLLDPHLKASGNRAFPEPDSMDEPTRQLQQELIALVVGQSDAGKRYRLPDQLLSVIFHEEWSMDPGTLQITKRVRAITPVIWQRRQTEAGDPVNDGETGLPVYYKNRLQQINLRNP